MLYQSFCPYRSEDLLDWHNQIKLIVRYLVDEGVNKATIKMRLS